MKRFPRLLIIAVLFPCFLFSQEAIDSTLVRLNKNLTTTKNDTQKVEALLEIGEYLTQRKILKAEQYLLEALELIQEKTKDEHQLGIAYTKLGVVNRRKGEHVNAIDYYLKAKKVFEKNNDTSNVADVIHNMALVYRYQKLYDKALKNQKLAIKLNEQTKDTFSTAMGYSMIGILYRRLKKPDSAFISYQKDNQLVIVTIFALTYASFEGFIYYQAQQGLPFIKI